MLFILLPAILWLGIWACRAAFGRALHWRDALGDLAIIYALLFIGFSLLEHLPATRRCFLLVDSACPVPAGDQLAEVGFAFLMLAPLGYVAIGLSLLEVRRRLRRPQSSARDQ